MTSELEKKKMELREFVEARIENYWEPDLEAVKIAEQLLEAIETLEYASASFANAELNDDTIDNFLAKLVGGGQERIW